ncbi:hypothetical protein NM2000175_2165 [Neisseria meningitidis 2000175]|nr:hypothetical protein NM2000175_2165 [Neisseria meningitidis 2000175]EOC44235.1 hypothetical protein NM2002004_2238 [Neisseria meningitidis 2002004]
MQFDRLGIFSVNDVQGNADAYGLVCFHSLEVDVLNFAAERVHLEIADDNVFGFTVQRQLNQRSMERFFFQCVEYGFVIHSDCNRLLTFTVQNAGDLAFATQAAARTSALCFTNRGLNFISHVKYSKLGKIAVIGRDQLKTASGLWQQHAACHHFFIEKI